MVLHLRQTGKNHDAQETIHDDSGISENYDK